MGQTSDRDHGAGHRWAADPVITVANKGSWLCATVLGTDNGSSMYPYQPRCLDVTDGINADRIPLQVWACRNTPGMNWRLVYAGIGYQRFYKLQTTIGGRCMDVPAGAPHHPTTRGHKGGDTDAGTATQP